MVGEGKKPLQAYLDIPAVIRIARQARVDAIHPGYGFLSENPDFARACAAAGIIFVGPTPEVMTTLGNKVAARNAAVAAGVPVMPATGPLPREIEACKALAAQVGYPLMLKASWGGGGRGMRVIESEFDLVNQVEAARREAGAAFGNDEVYLEKLVRRAHHVEVQITQASGHPVSAEASVKALEMLTATGSSFTASMLRDMLDGQRTEHDHILGMYRLLLGGSMA
jgi:pyruvate carboxylase